MEFLELLFACIELAPCCLELLAACVDGATIGAFFRGMRDLTNVVAPDGRRVNWWIVFWLLFPFAVLLTTVAVAAIIRRWMK